MAQKISQNAGAVSLVFVPAEIAVTTSHAFAAQFIIGVPRDFFRFALPAFPVKRLWICLLRFVRFKSPFAVVFVVSAIGALRPDKRAELSGFNPLGGFMNHRIGCVLRAALIYFSSALNGVV